MQLRFERSGETGSAVGGRCAWCGFECSFGMLSCPDEGGGDGLACGTCHAARHALDADGTRFRVTWAPEIDQRELSWLTRAAAYVRTHGIKTGDDGAKNKSGALHRAAQMGRELRARAETLERLMCELGKGSWTSKWSQLEEGDQERLLPGLRMYPTGFLTSEVNRWHHESNMSAFNEHARRATKWFSDEFHAPTGDFPPQEEEKPLDPERMEPDDMVGSPEASDEFD